MRKCLLFIGILCALCLTAGNTIDIPLTMSIATAFADGPTGSTPDPTDPNQFRASLTGNILLIHTPENTVSFVVIQEIDSERKNEDYFYSVSTGTISCPITRTGVYTIRIGCWNRDYVGFLRVTNIGLYDLNGHYWGKSLDMTKELPNGYYILRLNTNIGMTSIKFHIQQ